MIILNQDVSKCSGLKCCTQQISNVAKWPKLSDVPTAILFGRFIAYCNTKNQTLTNVFGHYIKQVAPEKHLTISESSSTNNITCNNRGGLGTTATVFAEN